MKRKSLTMILCLLTCLSLVGVGFAAWVVSAGDTATATGNIQVDTVTDARFSFEAHTYTADNIVFGINDTSDYKNAWLLGKDAKKEKLSVQFDIALKTGTALTSNSKETWAAAVTVSGEFVAPKNQLYKDAKTAGIIEDATVNVEFKADGTTSQKAYYTVTVTFTWGEAFDPERLSAYDGSAPSLNGLSKENKNLNPYEFYNSLNGVSHKRPVETWGDDAYYYLDLLQKLNDATIMYTVTLTATPNNVQ